MVISKVGADGNVVVTHQAGAADLAIDIAGYYTPIRVQLLDNIIKTLGG
jgi:hypothetical protein